MHINPLQVTLWEQQFIEEQKQVASIFLGQNEGGYNNTISKALDVRPFEASDKHLRVLNVGDFAPIPEGRHETFEFQDISGRKRIATSKRYVLPIIYDKFMDKDKGNLEMTLEKEILRQVAIKAIKAKEISIAEVLGADVNVVNWDNTTSTLTLEQDGGTIIDNSSSTFNTDTVKKIKTAMIKSELIGAMASDSGIELFISQDEMNDLNAENDYKSFLTIKKPMGTESWFTLPMVEGMLVKETAGGISKPILPEIEATGGRLCYALAPKTIYYEESAPIITHLTPEQMRMMWTDGSLSTSTNSGNFIDSGAWVFYFKTKIVRQLGKGVVQILTSIK